MLIKPKENTSSAEEETRMGSGKRWPLRWAWDDELLGGGDGTVGARMPAGAQAARPKIASRHQRNLGVRVGNGSTGPNMCTEAL